jgi:hypothetical protein
MNRFLLGFAVVIALGFASSPAMAQTGYYRNDYFGSGYTGVFDFLGSTSFNDPAVQGPYPYFGYGRPLYYTGYGGYYPGPANYRVLGYGSGYNSGYVSPYCGGLLPPSIMTP